MLCLQIHFFPSGHRSWHRWHCVGMIRTKPTSRSETWSSEQRRLCFILYYLWSRDTYPPPIPIKLWNTWPTKQSPSHLPMVLVWSVISEDDQIRAHGEQNGPDESVFVLRLDAYPGESGAGGWGRSEMLLEVRASVLFLRVQRLQDHISKGEWCIIPLITPLPRPLAPPIFDLSVRLP